MSVSLGWSAVILLDTGKTLYISKEPFIRDISHQCNGEGFSIFQNFYDGKGGG